MGTGFIVLEDFWSESELEEWRSAVEAAVAERPRRWKFPRLGQEDTVNEGAAEAEPDSFYENVFVQRINLWATNQRIKDLWLKYGNEVGRVAAVLEGVDGYRIWHDQALVKEGWANPTTLHVDNPFCARFPPRSHPPPDDAPLRAGSFSSPHAASIWMALDDVDEHNGALYFLPGSHKTIEAAERLKHERDNVTAATTPCKRRRSLPFLAASPKGVAPAQTRPVPSARTWARYSRRIRA